MPAVCLYLQAHQPYRLRRFSIFDIGNSHYYFDDERNFGFLERIVRKCYLPANLALLGLIKKHQGRFKAAFSITGVLLEQLERSFPDVIQSFKDMAATGCVEFLSETYYHSLSSLSSKDEFVSQIQMHRQKIKKLFGRVPRVFRNTELIFSNKIAETAAELGCGAVLAEGADFILDWRSPNFVYQTNGGNKIKLLLRNYKLSDDIAFRFGTREWSEWPLTAPKFASWVHKSRGDVINLFMDYETFGEHQWNETGIFHFLEALPGEILQYQNNHFQTPGDVIKLYPAVGELDFSRVVTWADTERDASAWLGNEMQKSAFENLYSLEEAVLTSGDPELIGDWRKLQTSDHFYYMCTKWFADGDVHKYFNPYESPYDAFIIFMNILKDLRIRTKGRI
ncbi:MAG: glycoside hydrolase family 57 protein, partial [Patescibacteria group bacterium]